MGLNPGSSILCLTILLVAEDRLGPQLPVIYKLVNINGAGDGGRTRNSLLGRQELCQLSYSRMVEDTGLEPVTFCLQGRRSSHLN